MGELSDSLKVVSGWLEFLLRSFATSTTYKRHITRRFKIIIVQELCESRGGRPELSVLTSLLVSVDVKNY